LLQLGAFSGAVTLTLTTIGRHWPMMSVQTMWIMGNIREIWTMIQTGKPRIALGASSSRKLAPGLTLRIHTWGEHPMSSNRFLCLSQAMREPRFLRCVRSTEAQLPPPNPNPTGIQIHWIESAVINIQIQLRQVKLATKGCDLGWKHISRQGHDGQFALETEAQKMFVSKPRRRAS
jgi:hypothetical protein